MPRPGASLRPGRAHRSRDHLATGSIRSKLPPLSVPVSPSPVSHGASRDFVALDRPFDDGRSNCKRRCRHIHCVRKYNTRVNIHVEGKTTLISPIYVRHARDGREGCVRRAREEDSRASHRAAPNELNLAAPKRAQPWRGWVKT